MIVPKKLQHGDEIRVIAPAQSLKIVSDECRQIATHYLESLGLKVTFGKHVMECDLFLSSSVKSRVEDLHAAFVDPQVKGIFTVLGGFNSNQLLEHIDFALIAANPKILCGFSDITALQNAIFAKTGLVTYSGPHYSSFGMKLGNKYTKEYFSHCLFEESSIAVQVSESWSNDAWYLDQENRSFVPNSGCAVIQPGQANGQIIGGNLGTLTLLKGTEFMPSLKNSVLFLEEDALSRRASDVVFDRLLQSLIHQEDFASVQGIVIGRFEKAAEMTAEKIRAIIHSKTALKNIPVICDADFGHTTPFFTFPIGGEVSVNATDNQAEIILTKH